MFSLSFNFIFLNIYAIPLYILLFITFILIHLNRRIENISKNIRVIDLSYTLLSFKILFILILPLLLIIFLNFLSFRSTEQLFFFSDCLNFFFYQKFFFFYFLYFY